MPTHVCDLAQDGFDFLAAVCLLPFPRQEAALSGTSGNALNFFVPLFPALSDDNTLMLLRKSFYKSPQ